MYRTTINAYLASLGVLVAADGIDAYPGQLVAVAYAAHAVVPAAAAVLTDTREPEVARLRALAIASAAVLRDPAAARSLHAALAHPASAGAIAA